MDRDNRARKIPQSLLPSTDQAVQLYRGNGGRLTDPAPFGSDPLASNHDRQHIRDQAFRERFPSFDFVFHRLVNGDSSLFRQALLFYIDITKRLASS